jgi:predicted nucleotidyltransferase component of viral defense system
MTTGKVRNMGASVRARLLDLARRNGDEFNFVLTRYGLERLLFRLASTHGTQFVLKGAMLFPIWSGSSHRATHDMDLLGYGSPKVDVVTDIFRDIAAVPADDGVVFLPETVKVTEIREDAIYDGMRVTLEGRLDRAEIHIQVDIGFGDDVTPPPVATAYPTLLPMPPPVLRVYPRETVIAEKFHTMVELGQINSRMKDFYDLWFLAGGFEFDGALLASALRATFARRKTALPTNLPSALTNDFANDPQKQIQWRAFVTKARLPHRSLTLADVITRLRAFLMPVLTAQVQAVRRLGTWIPDRGWRG